MRPIEQEKQCYSCKSEIRSGGSEMWVDHDGYHFDRLGEGESGRYMDPIRFCSGCADTFLAVDGMRSALAKLAPPSVRTAGFIVRAFDPGFLGFEEPGLCSQIDIEAYDIAHGRRDLQASFFYDRDVVRIRHFGLVGLYAGGRHIRRRRDSWTENEVSAAKWRSHPVEVFAKFVGIDIASVAGPMLQVPDPHEIVQMHRAERDGLVDQVIEQDSGRRARLDQFLDVCEARDALSGEEVEHFRQAWTEGSSLGELDVQDDCDDWFEEEDVLPFAQRAQSSADIDDS